MLDILRLRVLAAIAAQGSVTKAAKQLNYSQPAVSHHLARLEAETGAKLVQRVGRGIRLTPEGEHLARRATEIVGRVDTAAAELSAMVGLRTGRVRVAGFQSALAALVPHAAGTLRREHPGIELHLIEAHPRVALDLLRAGQVDVAVVFRYDDTTPDDIRATHLFDDPMYLLSLEPGQTLAGNRDSAWIAGCENCRREFLEACDKAGFAPPITYTSDDIIVQQALVAAGMGVTTMPGLALRTHHAPGIQASVLRDFRRHVYLATYGDPPDPPATTAFITALHHAVQQTRPGEPTPPTYGPALDEHQGGDRRSTESTKPSRTSADRAVQIDTGKSQLSESTNRQPDQDGMPTGTRSLSVSSGLTGRGVPRPGSSRR